jgi:oligopeptide/dipeptide ABC transporter ATP-binding protein
VKSPLLKVDRLETSFFTKSGVAKAVDSVSYHIDAGETLGLVGESGCGKSVTSFSILGLLSHPGKVTGGHIYFQGQDLAQATETELRSVRGKKIAMIFQEPMTALNPVLTIGYQIAEQIQAHEPISKQAALGRAIDLLARVGIPAPEKRVMDYPHQLSGGMRQRAMIAMALSCGPALLIADEPTTALDVTIQAQILDLLQRLQSETGMAMQFITHDLGVIAEVADRIVVMYAGRVVETATTDELFSNPKHPYTIGLLNSIPSMTGPADEDLKTIPGSVPSLLALPRGCAFQNRCSRATDLCREGIPTLAAISATHSVACFRETGGQ